MNAITVSIFSLVAILPLGARGANAAGSIPKGADDIPPLATTDVEGTEHQVIYVKHSPPAEIIIDNDGEGTSSSGEWELRTYEEYYGGTLRVSPHGGGEGDSYTFEPDVDGTLQVSLMWYENHTWGSDKVYVDIYDGATLLNTVRVDQTDDGGSWINMGTYDFTSKAKMVITKGDILWASVDAAKFTYAGPQGSSWFVPFDNLTDALIAAADGDEIWVAEGTYVPGSNPSDTFPLQPYVQIFGGFAGEEESRDERDWFTNETILSGSNICSHVLLVTDESVVDGFTVVDGNSDSNGGGIYVSSGSVTIANCTIMDNSAALGGGAFIGTGAGAEIRSCLFCTNQAEFGAAIACEGSLSVSVLNCLLSENAAATKGGAVWVADTNLSMTNCIVSDNLAFDGAGVCCSTSSTIDVDNCTVAYNRSIQTGGGMLVCSNCNAMVNNSVLWGNLADNGPQVALQDAGASSSAVSITYSDVQGGLSEIYNSSSVDYNLGNIDADPLFAAARMPVARWKFDEQTGLTAYDSVGENHASIIGAQRTTGTLGGALWFDGVDDHVHVPFVNWPEIGTRDFSISAWISPSALAGDHRMIVADQEPNNLQFNLDNGGTSARIEVYLGGNPTPVTSGNLSWDLDKWYHVVVRRTGGIVALYRDSASVGMAISFEYVDASTSVSIGYRSAAAAKHPFHGAIDDVRIYDRALSTGEIEDLFYLLLPDYHLQSTAGRYDQTEQRWVLDAQISRCIDAGNPGSPLRDEPLSVAVDPNNLLGANVRIDMGAYGGMPEASMPPHEWVLLADVTNDGVVDFVDYAHAADIYGEQDEELPADLHRDGDVDLADMAFLAADWLKTTSWHGL